MDGTEQGCPALVRQPKAQYPCFRDRSHRCRCRSFVAAHRLAPRPLAPLLPLPVWAQRCCTPTRCRPTFSVQRSTFNSSRLSPLASPPRATAPAADLGAAPLHPYTLSSHVQRATFNLQLLTPLAPRLAPSRHCSRCRSGRSAAAPLHVVVPRSTCNVQPFNSSRLSLHPALRFTGAGGMVRRLRSHILPPFLPRQIARQAAAGLGDQVIRAPPPYPRRSIPTPADHIPPVGAERDGEHCASVGHAGHLAPAHRLPYPRCAFDPAGYHF